MKIIKISKNKSVVSYNNYTYSRSNHNNMIFWCELMGNNIFMIISGDIVNILEEIYGKILRTEKLNRILND